jgi:glycosyltransferase involved in cell wall biosynthesis
MSDSIPNAERPLRVVHVVASLAEANGGPPRSVAGLCQTLAELDCRVEIVTLDTRKAFGPPVPIDESKVSVHRAPCLFISPLRLFLTWKFRSVLHRAVERADVIHSHGIWLYVNRAAGRGARRRRLPHMISPRGNFHPASMDRSQWKKAVAWRAYVRRDVRAARCLHATAGDEARHIRALGFKNPIAVLPTGIQIPEFSEAQLRAEFEQHWPELVGKRVLLFLGRIHPHKGVFRLGEAWAKLAAKAPDWHLVMAGHDEVGCEKDVKALLESAGLLSRCSFPGKVSGMRKWSLLANCDIFVLPSDSENFGVAIAEALAVGRPVLTTNTTPWEDLEKNRCGWRIPIGTEPLTRKLEEVLKLSRVQLHAMGKPAVQLIARSYNWNSIAEQMLATYKWMARGGPRPDCVWENQSGGS